MIAPTRTYDKGWRLTGKQPQPDPVVGLLFSAQTVDIPNAMDVPGTQQTTSGEDSSVSPWLSLHRPQVGRLDDF